MQNVAKTITLLLLVLSLAILPVRAAYAMPVSGSHCDSEPASTLTEDASHVPMEHAHHYQAMQAADGTGIVDSPDDFDANAGCDCCDQCNADCTGCLHTGAALLSLNVCPLTSLSDEKLQATTLHYPDIEPGPLFRPPRV